MVPNRKKKTNVFLKDRVTIHVIIQQTEEKKGKSSRFDNEYHKNNLFLSQYTFL